MTDRTELQAELAGVQRELSANVKLSTKIEEAHRLVYSACKSPEILPEFSEDLDNAFDALGYLLDELADAHETLNARCEELECEIAGIGEMSDDENAEYENPWMDGQR